MKIYFAYRSGYIPNNRLFKTFEAKSVLDWFCVNWDKLTDDKLTEELLGFRPYGFSITDYKSEEKVLEPTSLEDLREKISEFVYSNEVRVENNCVQVFTDDDEIELAWYVFDENFALENPDKVSVWFYENLPTTFSDKTFSEDLESSLVIPEGDEKCRIYFMSSTIYDSSHLEDLEGVFRIEGVSVPKMLSFFRENNLVEANSDFVYSLSEIQFIQQICKIFPNYSQEEICLEIAKYPFTELFQDLISTEEIGKISQEELKKLNLGGKPSLSKVTSSEHLIEISTNSLEMFYNYTVIFDDYWLEKHKDLGKSLMQFCTSQEI